MTRLAASQVRGLQLRPQVPRALQLAAQGDCAVHVVDGIVLQHGVTLDDVGLRRVEDERAAEVVDGTLVRAANLHASETVERCGQLAGHRHGYGVHVQTSVDSVAPAPAHVQGAASCVRVGKTLQLGVGHHLLEAGKRRLDGQGDVVFGGHGGSKVGGDLPGAAVLHGGEAGEAISGSSMAVLGFGGPEAGEWRAQFGGGLHATPHVAVKADLPGDVLVVHVGDAALGVEAVQVSGVLEGSTDVSVSIEGQADDQLSRDFIRRVLELCRSAGLIAEQSELSLDNDVVPVAALLQREGGGLVSGRGGNGGFAGHLAGETGHRAVPFHSDGVWGQ